MDKPKSGKAAARESKRIMDARAAAEMRKNAMSLRAIGKALKMSHEKVRQLVNEGLEELRKDTMADLEGYRAAQVARREEIIEAHKAIALDPSHDNWKQACDVIDKNEIAISKLMGTDQPIKVEQKTEHSGEAELVFKVFEPDIMPTANNEMPSDGDTDTAT